MKSKFIKRSIICVTLVLTTFGIAGCAGGRFGSWFGNKEETTESSDEGFDPNSNRIKSKTEEIESLIDNYYYFDADAEKQEEEYFDGIMEGLDDPYSVYYTKKEYEDLEEENNGEYQGIGSVVSKNIESGEIYVVRPIVDGPSDKAGILPNDVFVKVDDVELTTDMELDYVVDLIRGDKGTTVHLTMYREGEGFIEFDVVRDKVENVTVEYEMLDDKIGYISVSQFIGTTPGQFKEGIDSLVSDGAKGIVIDLRDNPGGMVTAVVEMCDYILDDRVELSDGKGPGVIVYTEDKKGNQIDRFECSDNHSVNLPIVVLVNGNSASASEIFTGCMKDYGKAVVVGTTTYGKGIVQSILPLSDGSAVKITIAKYFTPAGNDIHKKGIEPDVQVELDEKLKQKVVIEHDEDNQLKEALKQF